MAESVADTVYYYRCSSGLSLDLGWKKLRHGRAGG